MRVPSSGPPPRVHCDHSPPAVVKAIAPLLSDPVRAVRVERLGHCRNRSAGADTSAADRLVKATTELVGAEMSMRAPEAHLNLGLLDMRRRQLAEAEAEYRTALRLDPAFVPAMVNLADLDRTRVWTSRSRAAPQGDVDRAGQCDIRHSLGLLLVRSMTMPAP